MGMTDRLVYDWSTSWQNLKHFWVSLSPWEPLKGPLGVFNPLSICTYDMCDVAKKHNLSSTSAIMKQNGLKINLNVYALGWKYAQNSILMFSTCLQIFNTLTQWEGPRTVKNVQQQWVWFYFVIEKKSLSLSPTNSSRQMFLIQRSSQIDSTAPVYMCNN